MASRTVTKFKEIRQNSTQTPTVPLRHAIDRKETSMKKATFQKAIASTLAALVCVGSFAGCGKTADNTNGSAAAPSSASSGETYTVGICNYVDDASLNQIVANIESRLEEIGQERGVSFEVSYDNCNADASLMNQIISNFQADGTDLLVGVATPVAMAMQAATEGTQTPVVFAAVSDPMSVDLVDSLDAPGSNITGTSDYLDTAAIMDLIFAQNPETKKVGLLYDVGQDSSATAIADAKKNLSDRGVEVIERFTPSDNTVMKSELTIYETFAEAGIPHYTGADSFALNGAFLGYGVDYANLGRETADMIAEILLDGKDPAALAVRTFDNGTATINTEVCQQLGYAFDTLKETFAPYCTEVKSIETAEEFAS